ncbi:MAG TPA: class I fructose-bisphosphate aldolase [Candidatus Dormibacteraeota bacterium]|nr:class I fructose-bisphosphate aldolase [Candidatus Dormibacteraeota bacterium]
MILKPNLELPGVACPEQEVVDEVADDVRFKSRLPRRFALSLARVIQQPVLESWQGEEPHMLAARHAFYGRAGCNRATHRGEYNAAMERDGRERVPRGGSSTKRATSNR